MKKIIKKLLALSAVLFIFLCLPVCAFADTLGDRYGTDKLYEGLDEDTKEYIEESGVGSPGEFTFNLSGIADVMSDIVSNQISAPFRAFFSITVIIILTSFINSFDRTGNIAELAGTLAICVILLPQFIHQIAAVSSLSQGVSVFLFSAIPVYTVLIIASGKAAAGTTYGATTLVAANLISALSTNVITPLLSMMLGLGLSSSISHLNTGKILDSLYKLVKWLMIFAVTAFSGILSIQTAVTGNGDAAIAKTAKLIASSSIPIVGGALGDGVAAVQQSVNLIKGGAGAFGILALMFIFAPIAIESIVWCLVCRLSVLVCDLFQAERIGGFLNSCLTITKIILAIIISLLAVSVVSAAIIIYVGT